MKFICIFFLFLFLSRRTQRISCCCYEYTLQSVRQQLQAASCSLYSHFTKSNRLSLLLDLSVWWTSCFCQSFVPMDKAFTCCFQHLFFEYCTQQKVFAWLRKLCFFHALWKLNFSTALPTFSFLVGNGTIVAVDIWSSVS